MSTFRTLYRAVADAAGPSADPADLGDVEPRGRQLGATDTFNARDADCVERIIAAEGPYAAA